MKNVSTFKGVARNLYCNVIISIYFISSLLEYKYLSKIGKLCNFGLSFADSQSVKILRRVFRNFKPFGVLAKLFLLLFIALNSLWPNSFPLSIRLVKIATLGQRQSNVVDVIKYFCFIYRYHSKKLLKNL